ncbi:hypothetical protein [Flavobacterium hibernum]|jgi:hypothetical protein|uniref:Uncharacterized protein n=1 Tax=Flavobacterium hibernum TaxID=37752 RepID=A0A0D0EFT5_9FLAO|nr:hypothetical protein [Flavobacterium hibernum]KIO54664.1 hypothetical protein IW18_01265 [Flavobacterium hibernum]OXA84734.1 hypothetical protein B0A73_19170 [Flavobacterium hibernum]STO18414.1 Uncharacterised protein [Flavobacterium hibernum]
MEIDKFNGVTDSEFIEYFKIDLHSRMEIINYTYPYELLDEDGGFGEHVQRCVGLLKDYIIVCHREAKAALRWQQKEALENDGEPGTEMELGQMVQETPEEKTNRLEMEKNQEKEESAAKYRELSNEINCLIDGHREKVKIIYVDL